MCPLGNSLIDLFGCQRQFLVRYTIHTVTSYSYRSLNPEAGSEKYRVHILTSYSTDRQINRKNGNEAKNENGRFF